MNPNHELYTAADFQHMSGQEYEDSPIVSLVLDGGLSICKRCGEAEAGLDNPCKPNGKPETDA